MELLTEKQIAEMIVEHENNVKELIEKIKEELRNRKELKRKLEEAKQKEALLLQILERLDESEKMVRNHLELVAKMEDNESLKQLELIRVYEEAVKEQKETWEKYKAEYESITSVKEMRKVETRHLNATIKYRLLLQKVKDTKRMVQLRKNVRKRQEQLEIIKFAQMYIDYIKRQKRCQELRDQNKKLTAQAQQLRLELQEKEKVKQQKLDAELKKSSALMKPQQLPQVDLSCFIIRRDKEMDKLDAMSINSYILEEEYMNNNGQSISKLNSSESKAMDVDNQDTMHMDIDTQEAVSQERELVQFNETPRRLDFKGAFDNGGKIQCTLPIGDRNNNEMQNHMQSNSSNQSRSQVGEHNRTSNQNMNSQESDSDKSGNQQSYKKRQNQKQEQNEENTPMNASFENSGNISSECSTPRDRSAPTPAKILKSSFQMKYSHQQTSKQEITQLHRYQQKMSQQNQQRNQFLQHQNASSQEMMQQEPPSRHSSQEMYQQQQVSREVHQQNQQQQQQQQSRHSSQEMYQQQQVSREVYRQNQQQQRSRHPSQEMYQQNQHQQEVHLQNEQRQVLQQQLQPMHVSPQDSEQIDFSRLPSNKPRITSNEHVDFDLQTLQRGKTIEMQPKIEATARTPMETPIAKSTSMMPNAESTPFAQQVPFAMGPQSSVDVTPIPAGIDPSSMMSTTMHSADNYYLPDNISAYLGSEITEPGGSFELARRIHTDIHDSDLNSEDLDYDKLMRNACSPLHIISPKVQHPQVSESTSIPPLASSSINQNTQDSNAKDRAFDFGGFMKKQTNTTQRFF